jgi:hypothetical protein
VLQAGISIKALQCLAGLRQPQPGRGDEARQENEREKYQTRDAPQRREREPEAGP